MHTLADDSQDFLDDPALRSCNIANQDLDAESELDENLEDEGKQESDNLDSSGLPFVCWLTCYFFC